MKQLLLAGLLLVPFTIHTYGQSAPHVRASNKKRIVKKQEIGTASYYSSRFKGRRTASGARYDPAKMTAAHNRLPMGTRIKVTNLRNNRSVIVTVNDRLHYRNHRIVDLSLAAARKLGVTSKGVARVKVEVMSR